MRKKLPALDIILVLLSPSCPRDKERQGRHNLVVWWDRMKMVLYGESGQGQRLY